MTFGMILYDRDTRGIDIILTNVLQRQSILSTFSKFNQFNYAVENAMELVAAKIHVNTRPTKISILQKFSPHQQGSELTELTGNHFHKCLQGVQPYSLLVTPFQTTAHHSELKLPYTNNKNAHPLSIPPPLRWHVCCRAC